MTTLESPGSSSSSRRPAPRSAGTVRYANAACQVCLALYFLVAPGFIVICNLRDAALGAPGIPKFIWRQHRSLTPRIERWATRRVDSGVAAQLNLYDVPSTEWPIFTAVFYLWTTEALQEAWDRDRTLAATPPREYARESIEAAIRLVMDPNHHDWVRRHWGTDYWHDENVFFRSLAIAAITSHAQLTGSTEYIAQLRDQVETLSAELDGSRFGILNDYPGECYPIDVLAAVAWLNRAARTCELDKRQFVQRSLRAFSGDRTDKRGLIPYLADPVSGSLLQPSRGIGNSHVCIYAPELWPQQARTWYDLYQEHFWQDKWWASGFREFPKDMEGHNWLYDVDAGPVLAGFSPSGNAFGVAAARVNGRFDHALTLGAQVMAACWPLPDGTFLGTRILSDPVHAPYLGQAAMLYFFSRQPAAGVALRYGGRITPLVTIGLIFYFGLGALLILGACYSVRSWRRNSRSVEIPLPGPQVLGWSICILVALVCFVAGRVGLGMIALLLSQFLPRARRARCGRSGGMQ